MSAVNTSTPFTGRVIGEGEGSVGHDGAVAGGETNICKVYKVVLKSVCKATLGISCTVPGVF